MVSKRRSKAKTVSCVSWSVRGLPQLILTFEEVGTQIALTYVLTLDDPQRFPKSRRDRLFSGVAPWAQGLR
jgi:hypothetical protein